MTIKNTKTAYGWVTILLHWTLAVLILGLIPMGWYITTIDYYHPYYHQLFALHKSFGILTLALAIFNIIWFLFNQLPILPAHMRPIEKLAAHSMHYVLLFMMICIPMTGYFISTSEGEGIVFFGLFQLPALLKNGHGYADLFGQLHAWLGYGMLALVAMHAGAALKHEFINKDGLLRRMFGGKARF